MNSLEMSSTLVVIFVIVIVLVFFIIKAINVDKFRNDRAYGGYIKIKDGYNDGLKSLGECPEMIDGRQIRFFIRDGILFVIPTEKAFLRQNKRYRETLKDEDFRDFSYTAITLSDIEKFDFNDEKTLISYTKDGMSHKFEARGQELYEFLQKEI